MALSIYLLSSLGFAISLYSVLVTRKMKDKHYKPLCDISEKVSCTKAFSSSYGKLFSVHNSYLGLAFYPLIAIFEFLRLFLALKIFIALSLAFSIYLAYLSYVKMRNFCIVCSAIYLINFVLFLASYLR